MLLEPNFYERRTDEIIEYGATWSAENYSELFLKTAKFLEKYKIQADEILKIELETIDNYHYLSMVFASDIRTEKVMPLAIR